MNTRHRRTLTAISEPTRANVEWMAIERLFVALGAYIEERSGSRVGVDLNGVGKVFHRPHPAKEASKAVVRSVRAFLTEAGVKP
jgi:hypothetical protein